MSMPRKPYIRTNYQVKIKGQLGQTIANLAQQKGYNLGSIADRQYIAFQSNCSYEYLMSLFDGRRQVVSMSKLDDLGRGLDLADAEMAQLIQAAKKDGLRLAR